LLDASPDHIVPTFHRFGKVQQSLVSNDSLHQNFHLLFVLKHFRLKKQKQVDFIFSLIHYLIHVDSFFYPKLL
jgi:hypothetical protein